MTRKEAVETVKAKASGKGKRGASEATEAQKAAKKAGDKALLDTAAAMPHGGGKRFLELTKELDTIEDQANLLGKRKRGVRAALKEMKVNLRPYDHVRKMRKMEVEDMRSFEADVALYKDQLDMPLSVHQQVLKKEIEGQREAARDAMIDAGGDSGKEIGSTTAPDAPAGASAEKSAAVVPARNEGIRLAATATH